MSDFASVTMSGSPAEALHRTSGGDREAGLHLVEDERDSVAPGELSHCLEVGGLRGG